jgi:transcriptional regulator with XRE-family HTH domain
VAITPTQALDGPTAAVAAPTRLRVSRSPMEASETVGDRVRRYRRMKGLTQEQLADKADVDRRHLGRIETGDVLEPGAETMKKLAGALNVPLRAVAEPLGWYEEESARPGWEDAIMADERLSEENRVIAVKIIKSLRDNPSA